MKRKCFFLCRDVNGSLTYAIKGLNSGSLWKALESRRVVFEGLGSAIDDFLLPPLSVDYSLGDVSLFVGMNKYLKGCWFLPQPPFGRDIGFRFCSSKTSFCFGQNRKHAGFNSVSGVAPEMIMLFSHASVNA